MNRAVSAFMQLVAWLVLINFVAVQLYDPLAEGIGHTIWRILTVGMVIGMAVAVYVSYRNWRRLQKAATDTPEKIKDQVIAGLLFYLSLPLFALLLFNWIGFEEWNASALQFKWIWILLDVSVPMIMLSVARRLYNEG